MLTDIEIAESAKVKPITEVAASIGLTDDDISPYGKYIAKIPLSKLDQYKDKEDGKLVMVTAITPTPAGEGKTVTTIGLIQGLGRLGKNVVGALREPSIGPTFGIKGGATGGGYSQVYPMWDIDLHFTGDIHAVTAAHNLLSAIIDNELVRDNVHNIDPTRVVLKKAMDINARELRNIVTGLGRDRILGGVPHEHGFLITSASEISAILALSKDRDDLRARLERMVVAYTYDNEPVTVGTLGCVGSMMVLLKDAINPNLVQTLEGQPVLVHGFPFANIAHGTNSIIATKTALKLGDYVITEAGFASDLGGEKFMDIVCRQSGMRPDCVVIVASIRALMTHGGGVLDQPETLGLETLTKGLCNLDKHIENMSSYGVPIVVSINHFAHDTDEEIALIRKHCEEIGVRVAFSDAFIKGGEGAVELAETVIDALENDKPDFKFLYDLESPIKDKIKAVATKIYGADDVVYSAAADKAIAGMEADGFGNLPVCIAKTQASLSDDSKKKGAPKGWVLNVREVQLSAGAGFVVPVCGTLTLMPGLPKVPAAMRMDLLPDGRIVGLK
ncbi:MAG: formate--tetrahydrofolate ligase [Candidatus Methanomethylophilaceae archaeon]|nr:formate--tetrahydrofolate ligase [Candidatus Methanomethylophilaceae archaeon]